MSTFEELLHKQTQTLYSINRALTNYKKLGQAKMTSATTQNRMALLKEAYSLSQDLDAKLAACTDAEKRSTLPYFVENQFLQADDRYQEAMDYMAEVLTKVTLSSDRAAASTSQPMTTTSQPTLHLPRIQLPSFDARVRIHSTQGRCITARALLDQGSEVTLITEHLAQSLRLHRTPQHTRITGIGDIRSHATCTAKIIVTPYEVNEPAYSTTAIILRSLTRYVPSRNNALSNWAHLADLKLADQDPMSSDPIDILIGADLYGRLLLQGLRQGPACTPIAQNTTLGWILSGPVLCDSPPKSVGIHHLSVLENLEHTLRRFWEIEDLPSPAQLSPDDQRCKLHFQSTHYRTPSGRYVVRLPFKQATPTQLGESRIGALNSLLGLENRLRRDPSTSQSYSEFLADYEVLGHMKRAAPLPPLQHDHYYIPHHAVVKERSRTTRLRVVFNASRRTSNGTSLNDCLFIGPKLQQDLTAILVRWRQFQFVYTADITKMYRQILIDSRDLNYQRILWRESPLKPIAEYQLLTVTYGTSPAPFLALRVLQQLLEDEGSQYPAAISVLRDQAYVDDFLFGSDDRDSLRRLRDQTVQLLAKGGFSLSKWASNELSLLLEIDPNHYGRVVSRSFSPTDTLSILGINWNPTLDHFYFNLALATTLLRTKREILSHIAKLFDPLGWLAPIIITAKIYMQSLWSFRCDWDDVLPSSLQDEWRDFCAQLPALTHISVPRKISPQAICSQSLYGFADASTKAYAAAVYSRSVHKDGTVNVSLIVAKTRVAPIKTLSVPRLELCAAVLLARLMQFVRAALKDPTIEAHCWSDSQVTLAWLNQHPNRWKTFVTNRVAQIHDTLPSVSWHHVPTSDNPADCASRGLSVTQLTGYQLWWSGPQWLSLTVSSWSNTDSPSIPDTSLEERHHVLSATRVEHWDLATRYSSWAKLLRVTAYVIYFVSTLRGQTQVKTKIERTRFKRPTSATLVILNPAVIQTAKIFWLKRLQADVFPAELTALTLSKPIPKTSHIRALIPFLNSDGLLCARGRLANATCHTNTKLPIILSSHPLLTLLIETTHRNLLHAGPKLTLACLRLEFWIVRARTTIRNVLYKCVACAREKAKVPTELMGDLPAPRVTRVERPFIHTGVDYAGPVLVRNNSGRGYKTHKAYIAVFICLTIKAIHLELVSDYSSSAFIAAYHRFISRRGNPKAMYSDNGTTFQGANRELSNSLRAVFRDADLRNRLATGGVAWHFMPPNAPHFGGLWEAAVKSVKYHLKRSVGAHTLTFEEMTTFLCRVEACLNSRPLGPVSDCIDDYQALTPGHFLIGTALVASPEPSVLDLHDNRLSRWQLLQKLLETFWKAWSQDYLHTLHQRPKWTTKQNLVKVGQLVLLRHSTLPPSQWELGRIIQCHPGLDGLVRVVTVKTACSEYKRPLSKLCFLPITIEAERTHPTPPPSV